MEITISGIPGSGKSTLARGLAKKLGLSYFSSGNIRRAIASAFGLTIDQLNKIGEKFAVTDRLVDELIARLLKKDFVLDARLGWWLFPKSIKIFLTCSLDVAARRILKAKRKSEESYKNINEVKREIRKRMASDKLRYKRYYGISDVYAIKNFDIIIDTTKLSKKEMINKCLDLISKIKRIKKNKTQR
ncbi:MAG: (d)CMP kinase [Candidatus Pacearchaeota archaeon]